MYHFPTIDKVCSEVVPVPVPVPKAHHA